MDGSAFTWGNETKGGSTGKDGKLPRHVERMQRGDAPAESKESVNAMKGSKDGNNLPWGGMPKEKDKAFESGLPKDKGSMTSPKGERPTMKPSALPHDAHKAHAGYPMTIKSKSVPMKKGK